MTDILDFLLGDASDRARTANGRYRLVLIGPVEGHIKEQGKLTIFESTAGDATTRHYSPAVDFLRSAEADGTLRDQLLGYQAGIRQRFSVLLNQLNLLDDGASLADLQALAGGTGVPDASMECGQRQLLGPLRQPDRAMPLLSFEEFCAQGQLVQPQFRLSECEIVGPDWQVPNDLGGRWTDQGVQDRYQTGLSDTGPIIEGLGAHRLRTCGCGGGHTWMTNLNVNIAKP